MIKSFISFCGKEKKIGLKSPSFGVYKYVQKEVISNQNSQSVKNECGPKKAILKKDVPIGTKFTRIVVIKIFTINLPSQPFLGLYLGFHIFFHHSLFGGCTLIFTAWLFLIRYIYQISQAVKKGVAPKNPG